MKVVFLLIGLFLNFSTAKRDPTKRSLSCSGFPKQLSGRHYMVEVDEFGSTKTVDMTFNIDLNLQRMHEEKASGETIIFDYKEGKVYLFGPHGCHIAPVESKIMPEFLQELPLKLVASGSLGSKGTLVDLYSFKDDESVGVLTLESGDQCVPVGFGVKTSDSAFAGSFLDLKTTVDPAKLNIPDQCKQVNRRRSIPAIARTAVASALAWFESPRVTGKRGFPWITTEVKGGKRGFPWITTNTKKKGK